MFYDNTDAYNRTKQAHSLSALTSPCARKKQNQPTQT